VPVEMIEKEKSKDDKKYIKLTKVLHADFFVLKEYQFACDSAFWSFVK